jgi:gluconolactonase
MQRRSFLRGAAATVGSVGAVSVSQTAALAQQSSKSDPAGTTPPPRDWDDPTLVVYPDPAMEVFDPRFKKYVAGTNTLHRVWKGGIWTEGPVYFGDMHCVLFSDVVNNRMMRYDELTHRTHVFRQPSNNANGNTRDRQGRLVTCEQGLRRLTRTEYTGDITVLADSYQGKKLNSPNGVIVKSDDTIWFTDPTYGIEGDNEGTKAQSELPRNVYRIDPKSGQMTVAAGDFTQPNGLCFSPDEKKLYISDTAGPPSVIRVFDVSEDGKLTNDRVFHDLKDTDGGIADDMRVDVDGNLWSAGGWAPNHNYNGVSVYAPDGTPLGRIVLPEVAGNLCFGGMGHHHSTLYICATHSLYAYNVGTRGVEL